MKQCRDVEEWISENVEQWVERQEQRCKKWPWPLSWLCSLVTFLVKVVVVVVTKVLRVVCETVFAVLNVLAAIVNLVLAIPLLGALIRAIARIGASIASYFAGLLDGAGRALGLNLPKNLRVHVVVLCEGNYPLAYEHHLRTVLDQTRETFMNRAQIRVHFTVHEPLRNPPEEALRIGVYGDMLLDEAWIKGSWHQMQTLKLFEDNLWSLLIVGQPIIAYVIRDVGYDGESGAARGASGGPLCDWVAVEMKYVVDEIIDDGGSPTRAYPPTVTLGNQDFRHMPNPELWRYLLAHELGHALGLLHSDNPADLMYEDYVVGDMLSPFEVGIVRNSTHVTFL